MIKTQSVMVNENKMVIGRIFPEIDLIEGIEEICIKNNIEFGVVVSAIGSLSKGCIVYATLDNENKMGIKYSDNKYIEGPLELLCCQGMIGKGIEDEFQIHLHGIMGDRNSNIIGGHFISKGNKVLVTVEVSIQVVEKAKLIRKYDYETEFSLFNFIKRKNI